MTYLRYLSYTHYSTVHNLTSMDDPAIFTQFITNAGATTARARTAITDDLVNTFTGLLTISEADIDQFTNSTHSLNRNRANNQAITISLKVVLALKALRFELKDRVLCNVESRKCSSG